ncbi:MAG: glutathione S-transferase family protein [Rhizobiaceae bacterium]|nr:glutathione S-transferase family protein [Rhizobiaceae bacterium]
MQDFHLISHHLCPYVQRAVIVLTEKDIAHKRTYIDLSNKPDWFKKISPLGKVPILETEGAVVFESQIIAEYLDEITPGSLHPSDPLQKAHHRSWIEFGSQTLNAIAVLYSAKDADTYDEKHQTLADKLIRIEQEIDAPFFAGETFHIIDGVWGTIFRYLDVFDTIQAFQSVTNSAKLTAWRSAVMARASVGGATPEGYQGRLMNFLKNKNTHISTLVLPST